MTDDLMTPATTVDPVEKRLTDKDAFINQLQTEMADLRAELRTRQTLEELTDKITRPAPAATVPDTVPATVNAETKPDFASEVKKILAAETAAERRKTQIEKAKSLLSNEFGNDYNNALTATAANLGVSTQFLTDMAATSPEGLFKLVKDNQPAPTDTRTPAPPRSVVNTQTNLGQSVKKNKAYFDNIRRTDLATYFSPKLQNEMVREAEAQGSAFFS